MAETTTRKVLQLIQDRGILRARDLEAQGISPTHLQRLYERGLLQRSGRGVYLPADAPLSETTSLEEVALRVPSGIICLLSALQFHGLTTQLPHQVWVALPLRANTPRLDYPSLRVVRMSGEALSEGIEEHCMQGGIVHIFSPAKTVADCFKFRSKVGLDVALEALTDCWRKKRVTMNELWHYAKVCRVSSVMRPYLESLTI